MVTTRSLHVPYDVYSHNSSTLVLIAVVVVNKISLFFSLEKHNPLQSVDTVEVHSATPGILADGCG